MRTLVHTSLDRDSARNEDTVAAGTFLILWRVNLKSAVIKGSGRQSFSYANKETLVAPLSASGAAGSCVSSVVRRTQSELHIKVTRTSLIKG